MGTRIPDLEVVRVVDGDTIRVRIGDTEEALRFSGIDTEESLPGSDKPVTRAGRAASAMLGEHLGGDPPQRVDIEFETDDPVEVALVKHRDNYGRLLCVVHRGEENLNLKLIREGWSPYFIKYGRSLIYHDAFTAAEAEAQAEGRVIWDPEYNHGGPSRDYANLIPWWSMRALAVEDYRRRAAPETVLSVRLDYPRLLELMATGGGATVFCDLQDGINRWAGDGAVIYAGSVHHKFNLWIPDARSEERAPLLRLIETRYAGQGRGYVFVTGDVEEYDGKPQIVLTDRTQLSDATPDAP